MESWACSFHQCALHIVQFIYSSEHFVNSSWTQIQFKKYDNIYTMQTITRQKRCTSDPAQIKVGHEAILSEKKDVVQFLSRETSAVVSSNQSAVAEKPFNICWTWRRSQVLLDNPQQSLLEVITRCNSFLVLLPEPASFNYTASSVGLK